MSFLLAAVSALVESPDAVRPATGVGFRDWEAALRRLAEGPRAAPGGSEACTSDRLQVRQLQTSPPLPDSRAKAYHIEDSSSIMTTVKVRDARARLAERPVSQGRRRHLVDVYHRRETAMWDTVDNKHTHLSHDVPCPRCGHAGHTYLPCSDSCDCQRSVPLP